MPAVSVIVPTRQRPDLIGRAINSLLAQTFRDFEILVVDNNPIDERIARNPNRARWLGDPRVRLVEDTTPHNAGSARNLGLALAKGDWITYLDDDDAYHPGKLERQLQAAHRTGLPVGSCGVAYHVWCRRRIVQKNVTEISGDDLLLCFFGTPTLFHRAASVRFDGSLDAGEDLNYYHRLLEHFQVRRVFHVPQTLVEIYRARGSHVNLNANAVWRACEATLNDFGSRYTEAARRVFRERARMGFYKLKRGYFREMLTTSIALLQHSGLRDRRLILNCFLFKFPWMRYWLVS